MSLTMPQNEGKKFELCPEGNHIAVCVKVIDLGTQLVTYEGETKKQRKIYIGWETSQEFMEDGRPFVIGKRFTLSSHEKATLRKWLEAWRAKRFMPSDFGPGGFQIKNVLGAACMLQVVHTSRDGNEYANVETVASLPKGMPRPEPSGDVVYLSLEADEFDDRTFNDLSEKMQETIADSPEYDAIRGNGSLATAPTNVVDDDIDEALVPF